LRASSLALVRGLVRLSFSHLRYFDSSMLKEPYRGPCILQAFVSLALQLVFLSLLESFLVTIGRREAESDSCSFPSSGGFIFPKSDQIMVCSR